MGWGRGNGQGWQEFDSALRKLFCYFKSLEVNKNDRHLVMSAFEFIG